MKMTLLKKSSRRVALRVIRWKDNLWIIPTSGQLLLSEALTSDFLPICCEIDSSYMIGFDACENIVDHKELIRPQITKAT